MNSQIFRNRWGSNLLPALYVSFVIIASLIISVSVVKAQNSDFGVNANPSAFCVSPGLSAQSVVSVSSIGGFSGTVKLADSVIPTDSNVTLSSIPQNETLGSGQTVSFNLSMFTSPSTPLNTYTVSVYGFSDTTFHAANIQLTVSSSCSVGGIVVPTTLGSIGSNLSLGIALAGLIGIAATSMVYVNRVRARAKP